MPRPDPRATPVFWTLSRIPLLGGALLALLVLASLVGVGWYERDELLETSIVRNELLARVLDDHATRSVETTAVTLAALGELVGGPGAPDDLSHLGSTLSQAQVGLPFVRSIAVLDTEGRVLASSSLNDVDQVIELRQFGRLPGPGRDAVGPWMAGRQLADVARNRSSNTPRAVGFIPLLRRQPVSGGGNVLLVALMNPDAFANYQELALSSQGDRAVMTSYDGRVLAGTGSEPLPQGDVSSHPVFARLREGQEHGSFIGTGFGEDRRIVAFRASRSRPLVVIVEQPYAEVLDHWVSTMRWFAVAGGLAIGFIAAMSWTAWRSLRSREWARSALDEAQKRVARSERELSVLVKSVQELIFRTDEDGVLTFINARWSAIRGEAPEQALGCRLRDLVVEEHRDQVDALFALGGTAGIRTAQVLVRTGEGAVRRFDLAVAPLRGPEGIAGFAGSAVDITERWQAQHQLQAQLAFTGLLLEVTPIPVSMTDPQGRFASVNQAWEEFTGRFRTEVIGRRVEEVLTMMEARTHDEHLARLLREGGRLRCEISMPHADGSQRDVVMTKVLVPGEDGQPLGILCTVMDVSEFREAERATREARDAAEETSRAKSEFIANISHELRTPLQSILGFSELGMMRSRPHDRLAAMFEDIHTSGERMLALVNDLLDVSKIESTVGTFHLERTDLRTLVRAVAREVDPLMQPQQLRLRLELSEQPLVTKVDPLRFQQVIRNVLANAIKFSPPGQCIDVVGELTEDGEIAIRVRDHGPGIPPGELEAIFEAFVQSTATKNGAGGTGLGLAICRKIIDAHEGRITAGNAPGGGAVFHIMLPARSFSDTLPAAVEAV